VDGMRDKRHIPPTDAARVRGGEPEPAARGIRLDDRLDA
jgi:hypothetical protein